MGQVWLSLFLFFIFFILLCLVIWIISNMKKLFGKDKCCAFAHVDQSDDQKIKRPEPRLQSICWFDQDMTMTIQQQMVNIPGIGKCRILTARPDLLPGSFGVRMKTGKTSHIRLKNQLPFLTTPSQSTCICDADLPMMPDTNTNPCWTNLHFHGFWGSAEQDDVYACVKPSESRLYSYHLHSRHPTGIYIEHVHNFSSSVTQDHITPFIIQVYNSHQRDYPKHIPSITLFIVLAYMQTCPPNDPDQCVLESFDFPKYASGDFNTYAALLQAGPKLLLANGQINPYHCFPACQPVIIRVGWMGILDICRFRIVDDQDQPLEFRILSIDSLPISDGCNDISCDRNNNIMLTTEFLAAHMQRFDVMVIFPKPGKYRIQKYTTTADNTIPFSVPTRTIMTIYTYKSDINKYEKSLQSAVVLQNPYWVQQVNRRFRNMENLAAWRTIRFNYPQFPDIEGSMFDLTVQPAQIVMVANRSEVWWVSSASGLHSLHIHLQWFLIMAHRASASDPWIMIPKENQWFQDTLTLESGHEFLVWMFPFADKRVKRKNQATGKAMVHCHMSDHTDANMMLSLLVVEECSAQVPSGIGIVKGAQSPEIFDITFNSSCDPQTCV